MRDRRALLLGLVVAALLAVGLVVAALFRSSDEGRIRAKLVTLTTAVRVTSDDVNANPIARFARVNDAFGAIFEPDVRVSIPELTGLGAGRRALAEAASQSPRYFTSFEVELDPVTIKMDEARTSALVAATAHLRATEPGAAKRRDERAVDFRFAKSDGEWRITSVTVWPKDEARPE